MAASVASASRTGFLSSRASPRSIISREDRAVLEDGDGLLPAETRVIGRPYDGSHG